MMDCLFCKFASKTLEKKFEYEDENIMVFADIHPVRPVHLLIVPKKHFSDLLEIEDDDLLLEIMKIIKKMAKEKGLDKKGFRVLLNGGGAQAIEHLHFHLFGPVDQTTLL